jgi:hypothetical protein
MTVQEAADLSLEEKQLLESFLKDIPLGDFYTVRSGDKETWDGKPYISCLNVISAEEAEKYRASGGSWTYCEKTAETSVYNF